MIHVSSGGGEVSAVLPDYMYQSQVSVPLISQLVVSYRKGGTTPHEESCLKCFLICLLFILCYYVTSLRRAVLCLVGVHVVGCACNLLLFVCRSN